jgi:N-acetylglucosaminyl-diphospho-decaprenol L-rhamnosyltransferase
MVPSPTASQLPTVTVTLVLYKSEQEVARCIQSIRTELDSGFAELIAVDNASPDDSVAVVRREAPGAKVLRLPENRGFAAGANQAWAHARGRYWMLLNPDTQVSSAGLRAMSEWMDRHPSIGAASPEIHNEGNVPGATGHRLPSPWPPLLEASRLHHVLPRRLRGRILRGAYWTGGDQLDVGWVPGTAMMARRTAVEDVGVLDERFFMYGEDLDWCMRMRRAGWSIGVCTGTTVVHRGGASSSRTFTEEEVRRRIAEGIFQALGKARGVRFAKTCAFAFELDQVIEAWHPRRTPEWRAAARASARAWRRARRVSG